MSDTTMTAAPSGFRVGTVFGRAFELLFRDFAKFFGLSAIARAPYLLLTILGVLPTVGFSDAWRAGPGPGIAVLAGTMLSSVLSVICQAIILYGAFQVMRGQSFAVGESLQRGLARFFPIIGMLICMGIFMLFGFLMLIVPGIILYVMWSVALPVCVVERQGPFKSLSRSAGLTKGYRWKIFGILLLIGVVSSLVQVVIAFALNALAGPTVMMLGLFLWVAAAVAFSSITVAVIYHDLRVAKEGVDVERIVAVFD